MKEIGGYFGLEQLIDNEYYRDFVRLNTARNALLYVLEAKNIKKVYLPIYLCDSVSKMLVKHKYDLEFYSVNNEFLPIFEKLLKKDEYVYIVNYFGQITNGTLERLKQKYNNIIVDNTHAFFQEPIENIDTIYSCRKFFGVPDGAYLSTGKKLDEELLKDVSKDRMDHILGRFEGTASDYYGAFTQVDEAFVHEPLKQMSKLTRNILGAIDYEKVLNSRNENFWYLHRQFKKYNKLPLVVPDGPFAYPLYVENGLHIRKELAKQKVYIPTLWPNVLNDVEQQSVDYDYVANILPLPCDQRYGVDEIQFMIEEIFKCIN